MLTENAALRTIQVRVKAAAETMDKVFKSWASVARLDLIQKDYSLEQLSRSLAYCCSDLCGGKIPEIVIDKAFPSVQEVESGRAIRYLNAWQSHILKRVKANNTAK